MIRKDDYILREAEKIVSSYEKRCRLNAGYRRKIISDREMFKKKMFFIFLTACAIITVLFLLLSAIHFYKMII